LALVVRKPEQAIKHYEEATRLSPNDGEVQYNFGVVLDSMGRLEEAIERYEKAVETGVGNTAEKNLRNARARLLGKQLEKLKKEK
jgi:Tfp pilus assembly protein PilF